MKHATKKIVISRSEWGVLAFTILYLLVALAVTIRLRNQEFIFYFLVMALLVGGVVAMHLRVRYYLATLWGLSLWGLAHMAGGLAMVPASWPIKGETRVLYNWWIIPGGLKYDQIVHAFGFGLVTWVCWQSLRLAFAGRGVLVQPSLGLLTLCMAGGMGFGAANEVVEFAATRLLPGTNVGGYENTGWDLVANGVGSLIAAIGIALFDRVGRERNR